LGGEVVTEPPVPAPVEVLDEVVEVVEVDVPTTVEVDVVVADEAVEVVEVVELVLVLVADETSVSPLPCRVSVCGRVTVHSPVGPETVSV
jgi:hypothetical protein